MAVDRRGPHPWGIAGVALAGVACLVLPDNLRERVQGAGRDLLAPGQYVVAAVRDSTVEETATGQSSADTDWERQTRYWQAVAAQQQSELATLRDLPTWPRVVISPPLVQPVLRTARVIAWEHPGADEVASPIVRGGARDGVAASDLVMLPGALVLDQGASSGIAADQLLIAGRTVLGRIVKVSQLTSTIQRVIDPAFRGQAQIVRLNDGEAVLGAEGVLAGTGAGCQLLRVDSTEPVSVGDLVFTPVHGVPLSPPLYYGVITETDLDPGASEWSITVTPRLTGEPPGEVLVLGLQTNPQREDDQLLQDGADAQ